MLDNNFLLSFAGVLFVIGALCWAYLPGTKLFFRSCEWEEIFSLEKNIHSWRGIIYFISGKAVHFTKHFFPIGNAFVILRYTLFRDKYERHFIFSLFFHIVNVVLIYFVGSKVSSNHMVGLMSAILFGFTPIIADTILWVIMFPNIICMAVILTSVLVHPMLIESTTITNIVFFVTLFTAPLIYETGLLTPIIALSIFIINKQFNITILLVSTMPIIIYFIGRRIINGSFGMFTREMGSKSSALAFLGIRKSIIHILAAISKVILGFFSSKFKIRIYEALFILNLNLKNSVTILAGLMTFYLFYCLWGFINSTDILTSSKLICLIFPVMACSHLFMLSFNIQPWNKDFDAVRQADTTPWHMYAPSAFLSIAVSFILIVSQPDIGGFIIISLFVAINGIYSIREQINMIRPHTDSMKDSLKIFKDNGSLPYRGRRYLMEHYRLDGMFTDDMVLGYLRLGDRRFIVKTKNAIRAETENLLMIKHLHAIDMVWDIYKIIKLLNDYDGGQIKSNILENRMYEILTTCNINYNNIEPKEILTQYKEDFIIHVILMLYLKKIIPNLLSPDKKVIFAEEERRLNYDKIMKSYTTDYIELNFLIPWIEEILGMFYLSNYRYKIDEVVDVFRERDEELGAYVQLMIKNNITYLQGEDCKSVLVWGTGARFLKVSDLFLNFKIEAFIDNNPSMQGTVFDGLPVKAPSYLSSCNMPVFICSYYKEDIYKQIKRDYPHIIPFGVLVI